MMDSGPALLNNKYPFQVWLTSIVVIAPALLFMSEFIYNPSRFKIVEHLLLILVFAFFGLIYSIPAFLFSFLILRMVEQWVSSAILIRGIFMLLSLAGIFITFYFINGYLPFTLSLFYSASVVISGLVCRVHKKETRESFDSELRYAF